MSLQIKKIRFKYLKKIYFFLALATCFVCFYHNCKTTPTASDRDSFGLIKVNSIPTRAWISIDGRGTSYRTNYLLRYINVGLHTITLTKECYKNFEITVNVQENQ